jgi:predicted membrane-bound mannosyltransferase
VSVPYASNIHNPYIYAQTSEDILNLVERLDKLAPTDAQKNSFVIKVMAPDSEYWPLPWYLRQFKQVGFWPSVPADPYSDAMIVSTAFQANLDQKKTHLMAGLFELRPQTFFELYVETNAWTTYVNGAQRSQ